MQDPFGGGEVKVFQYNHLAERRVVKTTDLSVLFDDSFREIGAKLEKYAAGSCWWVRVWLSPLEISRLLFECAKTKKNAVLKSMMPDQSAKARCKAVKKGGDVHICPYLRGVFNMPSQYMNGTLGKDPSRQSSSSFRLHGVTNHLEIHFMSGEDVMNMVKSTEWAAKLQSSRADEQSLVQSHTRLQPGRMLLNADNLAILSLEMSSKMKGAPDLDHSFQEAQLSPDLPAVALTDTSGRKSLRVLESAIHDDAISLDDLRELGALADSGESLLRCSVPGSGTVTITAQATIYLRTGRRNLDDALSSWTSAMDTMHMSMDIELQIQDVTIEHVVLHIGVSVDSSMSNVKLMHHIRNGLAQYIDCALAEDGSLECAYRRTEGAPRYPPCVENVLVKHARGQKTINDAIDVLERTHLVTREDARRMSDNFDVKQFRTHAPAMVRISPGPGTSRKLFVSGTDMGSVHRAAVVILSAMSGPGAQEGQQRVEVKAQGVAEIIAMAEEESERVENNSSSGTQATGSLGLDGLIKADSDLFAFKRGSKKRNTYARSCGPHRQPIALTDDELTKAGQDLASKKSGPKNLNYVCPEVWCEASKTAMSRQAAEASGWKCPDGETAVDMMAADWWRGASTRHIGFLKSTAHPDGYPLPCCFKTFGKMQKERDLLVEERGSQSVHADSEQVSKSGRYVMSASHIPLPPGRRGATDFGGAIDSSQLLRIGVDQRRHTLLSAVAVIEGSTRARVTQQLLDAMTPTHVATAASGTILAYILSQSKLDTRSPEFAAWFKEYAKTRPGSERLSKRGMLRQSRSDNLDIRDPDFAREAVIAHAYQAAVKIVQGGRNAHNRIIQALLLATLHVRYPEVSVAGGETYISCVEWNNGTATGMVSGLLFRDGHVIEPLVEVPDEVLHEVQTYVSASCGSGEKRHNQVVLEWLLKHDHAPTAQVCDEAHTVVAVQIEGGLIVPFPLPHYVAADLPLRYMTDVGCADPSWSTQKVSELFNHVASQCDFPELQRAVYGKHCVKVGEFIVPLAGGEACLASFGVRTRALSASLAFETQTTVHIESMHKRDVAVRGAVDHMLKHNDKAYVVLTSPLSPLTSRQKQALFEHLMEGSGTRMQVNYADALASKAQVRRARPGELYLTDDDFITGRADFLLNVAVTGSSSLFKQSLAGRDSQFEELTGLDEPVNAPHFVPRHTAGRTSTMGSIDALCFSVAMAGGRFGPEDYGRVVARRALLNWSVSGHLQEGWPEESKPALQRAMGDKQAAWSALMMIASHIEPTDEDVALAFSGTPVRVEMYNGDGVKIGGQQDAPWKVMVWRTEDGRLAFATKHMTPILPAR